MAIPAPFTATNSANNILARWYIEIEGLRVRYGNWTPSWNPADSGTNRPIKPWFAKPGIPEITGAKAKPLNGSSSPHTFSVKLVDIGDAITALVSISDSTNRNETKLTAAVANDSTTTITVADSSWYSAAADIYVGRETMRATAAPSGTTFTVERGKYGSTAKAHALTDSQGVTKQVRVTDKPLFLYTREVILYESRQGLVEADGIKIKGSLDKIVDRGGAYDFECSGQLAKLDQKIGLNAAVGWLWFTLKPFKWTDDERQEQYTRFSENVDQGVPGMGYSYTTPPTHWLMVMDLATPMDKFGSSGLVIIDEEIIAYESKDDDLSHLYIDDSWVDIFAPLSANLGRVFEPGDTTQGRAFLAADIWNTGNAFTMNINVIKKMRAHFGGTQVKQALGHPSFTAGTDPISVALQIMLSGGEGGLLEIAVTVENIELKTLKAEY